MRDSTQKPMLKNVESRKAVERNAFLWGLYGSLVDFDASIMVR